MTPPGTGADARDRAAGPTVQGRRRRGPRFVTAAPRARTPPQLSTGGRPSLRPRPPGDRVEPSMVGGQALGHARPFGASSRGMDAGAALSSASSEGRRPSAPGGSPSLLWRNGHREARVRPHFWILGTPLTAALPARAADTAAPDPARPRSDTPSSLAAPRAALGHLERAGRVVHVADHGQAVGPDREAPLAGTPPSISRPWYVKAVPSGAWASAGTAASTQARRARRRAHQAVLGSNGTSPWGGRS